MITQEENPNRNCWKLSKIIAVLESRDGKVRGVKLQTGTRKIERPIQAFYPLELRAPGTNCKEKHCAPIDTEAQPCSARRAANQTKGNISAIANYEQSDI